MCLCLGNNVHFLDLDNSRANELMMKDTREHTYSKWTLCYQGQELASFLKHNYVLNEAHPVLCRHATAVGDDADMLCMPEPETIKIYLQLCTQISGTYHWSTYILSNNTFFSKLTENLQDLRFWQQCWWTLKSCKLWCCVNWQIITGIKRGLLPPSWTPGILKIEGTSFLYKSVTIYHTTWHHIPEDLNLHQH
jgi:hypothetical protein